MYSPFGGKWCSLLAMPLLNNVIRSALHDSLIIVLHPENIKFDLRPDYCMCGLGRKEEREGRGDGGKVWELGRNVGRVV